MRLGNMRLVKNTLKGIGKKGVGTLATAAVLITVALFFESVIVNSFIADIEVMKRSAREIAVINAINYVEFAKHGLRQSVNYSIFKASDDILSMGGLCSFDSTPCGDEDWCRAPANIPTQSCDPYLRVYNNTTPLPFGSLAAPTPGTFAYYFINRTAAVYNEYSAQFEGPNYCPMPPGKITITDTGDYTMRVDIYTDKESLRFKDDNIRVIEHNTLFNDTVTVATFEIFEFGKELYVENDRIGTIFSDANYSMENNWCAMAGERCDITSDCTEDCFDGNCCCQGMFFGNVCGEDISSNYCENQLTDYCSITGPNLNCDYNSNGRVTAEEKYKCYVENNITSVVPNNDAVINATAELDGCFKVDHSSLFNASDTVTVVWTAEIAADCNEINANNCGCVDTCTGSEANCGDCIGITTGSSSGMCPSVAPWVDSVEPGVEKEVVCPVECCMDKFTCTQSKTAGRCIGINTEACDSPSSCCEDGECAPGCDCDDCVCQRLGCPLVGPWLPECCNGPGDPKPWVCEDCCDDPCTPISCGSLGLGTCDSCSGCSWRPGTWSHVISRNCRANVCGITCCEETDTLYKDVTCDYNYSGSARVDVDVTDEANQYPFGTMWDELTLEFKVVSGNAPECNGTEPVEQSSYVPTGSICCPALTTTSSDESVGCKSNEIIEIDDEDEGGGDGEEGPCITDSDCCLPGFEGRWVVCREGVCDIAVFGTGFLCP